MAKDGTNRGGARPGAGRKKKPLAEHIEAGTRATVMRPPNIPELTGTEMPKVKDYLKAEQYFGELYAEDIYKETWEWLRQRGCEQFISPMLLEQYAMTSARWIQCEQLISEKSLLSRHPTTSVPIASPFVSMSQTYMKQSNQLWAIIQQIVREQTSTVYSGNTPQDDLMERLLNAGK